MMVMAAAQGVGFALCMERDWSQWKLGWNIRLLAVVFAVCLNFTVWITYNLCVNYFVCYIWWSSSFAGYFWFWSNVYLSCLVCSYERSTLRINIQPPYATAGSLGWIFAIEREAALRNVRVCSLCVINQFFMELC